MIVKYPKAAKTKKTTTKKVTTTKETTTPAPTTVKAAAEKATASAYIEEISFYPQGNGSSFVLHVSGNYSYYHYEGYYTGGGAYDSNCASGKTSNSSVELTAGSVMSEVRAVVTPYNSNGVAGDKIYTSIHPQYSSGALNSDYNDNYASQDEPYAPENDIMMFRSLRVEIRRIMTIMMNRSLRAESRGIMTIGASSGKNYI